MSHINLFFGYNAQPLTMSPHFTDHWTGIDATGEKLAYIGRFWHPDGPGSYDITRLHFRWGAVITKAGGSNLTLSLQDVSTSAGPVFVPDETQDETVAIANASIGLANTWFRSDALSANRTVSYGDWIAAVLEFDGGGRLGSDVIRTSGITSALQGVSGWSWKSGTWSYPGGGSSQPSIVFECTDGSYASFEAAGTQGLFSSLNNNAYNTATNPDERALALVPPATMTLHAVSGILGPLSGSADFDIVIYQDTTVVHTESFDGNRVRVADNLCNTLLLSSEVTLTKDLQYYIALKPTTANNVRFYTGTVYAAGFQRLHGFPVTSGEATRNDGGPWSAIDSLKVPLVGLHVSDIQSTSGGGSVGFPLSRVLNRI